VKGIKTLLREPSWRKALQTEFEQDYFHELEQYLQDEQAAGKAIFPQPLQWFTALNTTPLDEVSVVILGQDPYPTIGHAHGLCFSVQPGVTPLPKSLQNIYRELKDDLGIENCSGYLLPWAEQGVLLLNAILTVEQGKSGSHQRKGWERLTDRIIDIVNHRERPAVFVLWGAYAQKKGCMIDRQRHHVIQSPHPSPLSAYRGFYGSRPFSRINDFLARSQLPALDWQL
jgi:uracil-DNA glycosylase